jgi:soluble lytic murein transglycosylase-like protein
MVGEARVTKACRMSRPTLPVLVIALFLGTPSITRAFCFEEAGRQYGVSPKLLQSIAMVESRLHQQAVHRNDNGSVDSGLMQINSAWNDRLGLNQNQLLLDPCYNVMTGAKILRQCIDRYGYTWEAVGCYNASSKDKRVAYSWKILGQLKKYAGKNASPDIPAKTINSHQTVAEDHKPPRSFYFRVRASKMPDDTGAP